MCAWAALEQVLPSSCGSSMPVPAPMAKEGGNSACEMLLNTKGFVGDVFACREAGAKIFLGCFLFGFPILLL